MGSFISNIVLFLSIYTGLPNIQNIKFYSELLGYNQGTVLLHTHFGVILFGYLS